MATSGQFIHELAQGFQLIYDWKFPYDTKTGKITADWKLSLYVPFDATVRLIPGEVRPSIFTKTGTSYTTSLTWYLNFQTGISNAFGSTGKAFTEGTHLIATAEGPTTNNTNAALTQSYGYLKNCGFYDNTANTFNSYVDSIQIDGTWYYDYDTHYQTTFRPSMPDEMASTITCSTTYIGENATIVVNKFDSAFTTTVLYQFGNLTGTVISKTAATQIYWLVPGTFLNEMDPAATAGVCKLTCYTYDSYGNQVGEPKTISFNVLMDSNMGGPLFNPKVTDTNSATIALTGNNGILIKYFSNAYAVVGAVPQAGATIKSQSVENGGKVVNSGSATFEKVESPIFNLTATDSRQFTTKTQYRATMVEYSKLTCNLLVSTPTVAGTATVTIEGNYYNGSFGKTNNSLTVQYRMKSGNESYGAWQTVTVEPSSFNYKVEIDITGLDYQQLYSFQAKAADKLMTITTKEVQSIGKPVYDWGQNDFHISVALNTDKAINMLPDQAIAGTNPEGDLINALVPCDSIGNTVLGYGSYTNETGAVKIYGNQVDIIAANGVSINGTTLGGKVLYQGGYMMSANQKISLPEAVSDQANGIVLVFSLYRNGAAEDVSISTFYISKKEVELLNGAPHFFFMGINAGFSVLGAKYIYISDTEISGHEGNDDTGSNNGLTFNNASFVLRYVLGV